MNDLQTAQQTISIEALSAMLDDAAIDHEIQDEDSIYATGYPFNIWLKVDTDAGAVMLSTYWPFAPGTSEQEALAYANLCNRERIMVQFSIPDAWHRLWGHYWLSCRDAFARKTLLRSAQKFSCIFQSAVNEGIAQGVLNDGGADCTAVLN